MTDVIVIHQKDLEDNHKGVIGVASNLDKADELIKEHFGEFQEISKDDIRDSTLEYSKIIECYGVDRKPYRCEIWTEWFKIDNI